MLARIGQMVVVTMATTSTIFLVYLWSLAIELYINHQKTGLMVLPTSLEVFLVIFFLPAILAGWKVCLITHEGFAAKPG